MFSTFLNTPEKWRILGSCAAIGFLSNGFAKTFSLYFESSLSRYGASRERTSFPFLLCFCISSLISPLVSYLSNKVGLRFVFALGGLTSFLTLLASFFAESITEILFYFGIGQGIAMSLSTALIPQALTYEFADHIDKAYGFCLTAASLGALFFTALTEFLLHVYGLSGTFLLMSSVQLNILPFALLLKKTKPIHYLQDTDQVSNEPPITAMELHEKQKPTEGFYENSTAQNKLKPCKHQQRTETEAENVATKSGNDSKLPESVFCVFLDPTYIVINVCRSSMLLVYVGMFTLMVDALIDKSLSREQSVQVLMSLTIFDLIGRFCLGYFTDAGFISKINFVILCCLSMAVCLVLFNLLGSFLWMISIISLLGFIQGGYLMTGIGLVFLYVEKEHVRMANASLNFLFSPMSLCIPTLIGWFRDTLKSYKGFFYTLAAICATNALLNYVTPALARHRNRRKKSKGINI